MNSLSQKLVDLATRPLVPQAMHDALMAAAREVVILEAIVDRNAEHEEDAASHVLDEVAHLLRRNDACCQWEVTDEVLGGRGGLVADALRLRFGRKL